MKWFNGVMCFVCALFLAWCIGSWIDIVADNTSPNPTHSEFNAFVLLTQANEKDETRETVGRVLSVNDDEVFFELPDGNIYSCYVFDSYNFHEGQRYTVIFEGTELIDIIP